MIYSFFEGENFVSSALLHHSILDDDDIICFFYGLESMSDHDHGTSSKECFESLSDLLFRETIERRCGLVEEDDLWVFEKYFCDRKTLFLSS